MSMTRSMHVHSVKLFCCKDCYHIDALNFINTCYCLNNNNNIIIIFLWGLRVGLIFFKNFKTMNEYFTPRAGAGALVTSFLEFH